MKLLKSVEIYQVNGGCDCLIDNSFDKKMVNISGDDNCTNSCLRAYSSAAFWDAITSNGASFLKAVAYIVGAGILAVKTFGYLDDYLSRPANSNTILGRRGYL